MSEPATQLPTSRPGPSRAPAHSQVRAKTVSVVQYRGDIIAGALMLPESRVVADLLLRHVNAAEWQEAIDTRNVLKSRRRETAIRIARLIRGRLESMDATLVKMVRDGKGTVATHATLAAAIKHSRLLGDFLFLVVGEQYRQFGQSLTHKLWEDYLDECQERDPTMPQWSESTRKRIRSSVFQTLAQAGYIENTRTLKLQAVHVSEQVLRYLIAHREDYVLQCIQVAP
jgi:hypothetical protein